MPKRRLIVLLLAASACRPAPEVTSPSPSERPPAPTSATTREPAQSVASAPTPSAPGELDALFIEPLPVWTDRYADDSSQRPLFLNITAVMQRYGVSRAQAVEAQNLLRDQLAATPELAPPAALEQAIARVKAGEFEPPHRADQLERAPFIVVFDLDDTLYDQYYDPAVGARCYDLAVRHPHGEQRILLAPGWSAAFDRIRALGGAIVLFSANLDEPTRKNLAHWTYEGQPMLEHPAIAAVLTNSHLVQQERSEGPGAENPRRGRPVLEPSKDLRVFDEALERAIIVDDNPLRLFQFRNTRLVPKLDAEVYCDESDKAARRMAEAVLPTVVREIEDSVTYSRAQGVSFADAYLPYSMLGRPTVAALEASGLSRKQAIAWVRSHGELVAEDF